MSDEQPVTFEDILHQSTPEMQALARSLRALILAVVPDAVELLSTRDRTAVYGRDPLLRDRDQLVYIALPKGWVRLGFYYGGELPDPEGLLEGAGKRLRHIKVRSEAELQRPGVRELVRLALLRGRASSGRDSTIQEPG